MLLVYGDESHDPAIERVLGFAGVMGRSGDWEGIATPWRERLGGRNFHATDCKAGRKDFRGIPEGERVALYEDLVDLVVTSPLRARTIVMDMIAQREGFGDAIDSETSYYRVINRVVMACLQEGHDIAPQEIINFRFEGRMQSNYNVTRYFEYMRGLKELSELPGLMGNLEFVGKESVGAQVADLLAYEAMKHWEGQQLPEPREMTRTLVKLASAQGRFDFEFQTGDYFKSMRAGLLAIENDPSATFKLSGYWDWLKQKRRQHTHENRLAFCQEQDDRNRREKGTV